MRKWGMMILTVGVALSGLTGCGSITDYFTKPYTSLFDSDDDDTTQAPTITDQTVIESTAKFALAMGGVAPGRDELVIDGLVTADLQFSATDPIIGFMERSGYATFSAGTGAKIIPQKEGKTTVHYSIGGVEASTVYAVTIPPQSLIQILIGEARGQITQEASLSSGAVALTSRSVTAETIAAVVRNRVKLIDAQNNPGLFNVDPVQYAIGGEAAKYDAVITAVQFGIYQFSPIDPNDPSHDAFENAAARSFLEATLLAAYDQSVLSAAQIFDGTRSDPTGGAFGFRTPAADEGLCLELAAKSSTPVLPSSCDDPDARFPAFTPVQVLIHPQVPRLSDNRPAFIYYRARTISEPAVTTTP
jgi:hypothetical protein